MIERVGRSELLFAHMKKLSSNKSLDGNDRNSASYHTLKNS